MVRKVKTVNEYKSIRVMVLELLASHPDDVYTLEEIENATRIPGRSTSSVSSVLSQLVKKKIIQRPSTSTYSINVSSTEPR